MQPTTISDHHSLTLMIGEVCAALKGQSVAQFKNYKSGPYSRTVVRMLLGTAAAESGMRHRKQIGGGPARGLWQMEPLTAWDIFENYLKYRPRMFLRLTALWFNVPLASPFVPDEEVLAEHLMFDDPLACALARIKYLRDPHAIPEEVESQARYWKRVYNTDKGAGTPEHYMEMWEACECEQLLRDTGYWR